LEPCYMMYDSELSRVRNDASKINCIDPAVQSERLAEMSKRRWEWIRNGFNNCVRDCTREDAKSLYQLIDNLADLFKHRLHHNQSEPRAISFSISALEKLDEDKWEQLSKIIKIARRSQILFVRPSVAKDDGKQDDYYTFDRLLWIDRGLDPVGQN